MVEQDAALALADRQLTRSVRRPLEPRVDLREQRLASCRNQEVRSEGSAIPVGSHPLPDPVYGMLDAIDLSGVEIANGTEVVSAVSEPPRGQRLNPDQLERCRVHRDAVAP